MPERQPVPFTVQGTVNEIAAKANKNEAIRSKEFADLDWVRTMQNRAWTEFCDAVMPPRQKTWGTLVSFLADTPPQKWNPDGFGASWDRARLEEAEEGSRVQLKIHIEADTTKENSLYMHPKLIQAASFLKDPRTGKTCPEELLGVEAVGKGRKRSIPLEELEGAYNRSRNEIFTRGIDRINARVTGEVPGSTVKPMPLLSVTASAEGHDPANRYYYLRPEEARTVIKYFSSGEAEKAGYEADMNPDTLMKFLLDRANKGGSFNYESAETYNDLEKLCQYLEGSSPL